MKPFAQILLFGILGFALIVAYVSCEADCADRCHGQGALLRDIWGLPTCVCTGAR